MEELSESSSWTSRKPSGEGEMEETRLVREGDSMRVADVVSRCKEGAVDGFGVP